MIFSDQAIVSESNNIRVVNLPWLKMQKRVREKLGNDISIDRPYKLCDFKPAYGFLFEDYLTGYDYWGHCDCDLVFGDLKGLNSYFEQGYERIGEYGHLIFYKNTNEVNHYFQSLSAPGVPSWKTVSQSPKSFCFDEHGGMNTLCYVNRIYETHPRLFDDIIFYRHNFYSRRMIQGIIDNPRIPVYFEFCRGRLFKWFYLNEKWNKDESLYVHFQKRKMINSDKVNSDHYLMIPNQFIKPDSYDENRVRQLCQAPLFDFSNAKIMTKYYLKYIATKIGLHN